LVQLGRAFWSGEAGNYSRNKCKTLNTQIQVDPADAALLGVILSVSMDRGKNYSHIYI
jgi:hypothetical protein